MATLLTSYTLYCCADTSVRDINYLDYTLEGELTRLTDKNTSRLVAYPYTSKIDPSRVTVTNTLDKYVTVKVKSDGILLTLVNPTESGQFMFNVKERWPNNLSSPVVIKDSSDPKNIRTITL